MTSADPNAGAPKPLALQGLVNRLTRGLLRVPLVCRLVGRRLLVLYVVGRKTRNVYPIPIAYLEHEGALLLGTGFAWGRNLRTGEPVDVRYKGRRRVADVVVLTDEGPVTEHYAIAARRNPAFAKFNRIGRDPDGTPRADDLHAAWAAGARVFLLTLR
jgi:deazaflavin-dependent oxidoreductase (nitroreductase family)